jgi:hypothetical protein
MPNRLQSFVTGIPITRPLQTGRLGSFFVVAAVSISTTDTVIPILLGRLPSCYLVARNSSGGVVYDGSNHGTDWSGSQIVLRATVAGTYTLLVG